MQAYTYTIEDLFSQIRLKRVALPRFQRHEAWSTAQIEGVLENVLRRPSLPIGALLVLQVGDEEPFVSRAMVGAPAITGTPDLHLLDGQQRMTALWRSLNDDYGDFQAFVRLTGQAGTVDGVRDDTQEGAEDAPDVEIIKRWWRNGQRYPVWADDPKQVLERDLIPISILLPGNEGESRCDDWLDQAGASVSQMKRVAKLRSRIASYALPFLSLPVGTSQETALDVFIKMNTSASPLKDFDIVVAQVEGAIGDSLHDWITTLKERVPATAHFRRIEDLALAVGALRLGMPPLKKTYLSRDFGHGLPNVWNDVVRGIDKGLTFLRDEAIFTEKLLPTEVALYLISALWASVPDAGYDIEGNARTIIRKALWRASYTDRYLKTAATRGYADYMRLNRLITGQSDEEPDLFSDTFNPLPEKETLKTSVWPGRKDRLARAIVATSLWGGGYDFADGAPASPENIDRREFHHLYPVAALGIDRDDPHVSRALNCALITWRTNRKIAARTPKEYIDARAADAKLGEAEVRTRLESHLVPYDALVAGDYDAFLDARAVMIEQAMKKLCDGYAL